MNDWLSVARSEAFSASGLITALVIMLLFDVVSGLLVAFVQKKLNSTISRIGAARKVATLLVVGIAIVFSPIIPSANLLGMSVNLTKSVCMVFMVTECLSIIENVGILGVKIPKPLKDALTKLSDLENDDSNTTSSK